MLSNYKVIDWSEANDLKSKTNTHFLLNIDCNLSQVYQLEDLNYLIVPMDPFGQALLTKDKSLLDKWINECYFPTNEKIFKFYNDNADRIQNLLKYKDGLKNELCDVLAINKTIDSPDQIDQVYKILRSKNIFHKYQLHFLVLVGDYLMESHPDESVSWGIIETKQLLNPIRSLILIKESNGEMRYFKLEYNITGKWGYSSIQGILYAYGGKWSRKHSFDTIEEIEK